jgi:hypothetical protein
MTTPVRAAIYLAEHQAQHQGSPYVVFNPKGKPLSELPFIYGFNNGGYDSWWEAVLLAQDGEFLGNNICSHEFYMPHDLGVIEGSSPHRHEIFQKHYPDGYRMDFIGLNDVANHAGLKEAFRLNQEKQKASENKL